VQISTRLIQINGPAAGQRQGMRSHIVLPQWPDEVRG
jgi:hypothetical protein